MWGFELVVMTFMIATNSVLAAFEIALASISSARLDALVREKLSGAAAAVRMKNKMEASLAVVQLGITLAGTIAAAVGGAGAEESIEPALIAWGIAPRFAGFLAVALVVLPLTFVSIILGELVPKIYALRNKEAVCVRLAPPLEWFALIVWPAVWLFEKSVAVIVKFGERITGGVSQADSEASALQELRAIASMARMSRLIGVREEGIILNAVRLSRTMVRTAMLPADYISMMYVGDSIADCLIWAHHDMHTRFPVTEKREDPQAILGYVNFKDIVACLRVSPNEPTLRGILRPIASVQADSSMASALERMIHEHQHIALVRELNGVVVGMITLEDILEEVLGEIHDEYDRLPGHVMASGDSWVVGGGASLAYVRDTTGIDLTAAPETDGKPRLTLNDWVQHQLGRPADGGETVEADGISLLIRKVRRNFVQEGQMKRK